MEYYILVTNRGCFLIKNNNNKNKEDLRGMNNHKNFDSNRGKTCTGKPDREKEGKTVSKYKNCSPKEGMRCATEQDI